MVAEYIKPMLDVGVPRVFNCNALTHRLLARDENARLFFKNKPLNELVLIKDTIPEMLRGPAGSAIGTKLYFPFNDQNVYEGGRTIFFHERQLEQALFQHFGEGSFDKQALVEDLRLLAIFDRLPSLDPFLLKDVFLNEKTDVNLDYFEVGEEIWKQIELFILQHFEPVVKAAFPNAMESDERSRQLIEKIWEARDLEALMPLVKSFRLPPEEALEIFSAWKGINFYSYQRERTKGLFFEMLTWLRDLQIPVVAISAAERAEIKTRLEQSKAQMRAEWQKVDAILRNYQESYDKMFKLQQSSADFVTFLKNSRKIYWELGNSLGKIGHASYCWDVLSKRFPERKLSWEVLQEVIILFAKIFKPDAPPKSSVAW